MLLATTATAAPIRIVSFNVLHGGITSERATDAQRLDDRLADATAALRALAPDVLGLQETSTGRRRGDVAARFAGALDMHHVRAAAGGGLAGRVVRLALGVDEGPAIVSRFPIVASSRHTLDACDVWWRRVLLCATLATPDGPLDFCSTHADGSDCQLRSLAALLAARPTDRPLVVTGDMNAVESTPGMRALFATAGLRDAFRERHPGAEGFTVYQPVDDPRRRARRRIDYVLVRPALGGTLRVLESRVVLDEPRRLDDGGVLWPSDHHGVLAVVEMATRAMPSPRGDLAR